jgi:hypothetical protein
MGHARDMTPVIIHRFQSSYCKGVATVNATARVLVLLTILLFCVCVCVRVWVCVCMLDTFEHI